MSVILDALQKARTDRRKRQDETHPNSVARVLDPGVAPPPPVNVAAPQGGSRTWLIALPVVVAVICLLALIGGAFFLLYDQVRDLNSTSAVTKTEADKPEPVSAAPVAAVMPTPVPLSELPVQTPAPAAVVPVAPAPAVAPAAAPASIKLGSIVCEGDDCIANLNGRSVKVGDKVKNYTVTEITPSSVTLQGANVADSVTLSHYD